MKDEIEEIQQNTEETPQDSDTAAEEEQLSPVEKAEETADEKSEQKPAADEIKASDLVGYDEDDVPDDHSLGTSADHIIEALSIESIVGGTVRLTRIPEKIAEYVISVAYIILGGVCIGYPTGIELALPYLVGSVIAVLSVGQFIIAVAQREYRTEKTNKTASSIIYLILSIFILAQPEWAYDFIPTVWGVLGLVEAAHAFNIAIARVTKGRQPAYYIIRGIVEAVVAFLLLYRPEEYAKLHIVVFGVSLVLDGITNIPIIKKFLTGG